MNKLRSAKKEAGKNYSAPKVTKYGTVRELTKKVNQVGNHDHGINRT